MPNFVFSILTDTGEKYIWISAISTIGWAYKDIKAKHFIKGVQLYTLVCEITQTVFIQTHKILSTKMMFGAMQAGMAAATAAGGLTLKSEALGDHGLRSSPWSFHTPDQVSSVG